MLRCIFLSLLFLGLSCAIAVAAPFCVLQAGIPQQCLYDDITQCRKNMTNNGSCVLNPEAHITYRGSMNYCVVQSYLIAECNYIDRSQCNDEASRSARICIENPDTKKSGSEMYDYDSRIQR